MQQGAASRQARHDVDESVPESLQRQDEARRVVEPEDGLRRVHERDDPVDRRRHPGDE